MTPEHCAAIDESAAGRHLLVRRGLRRTSKDRPQHDPFMEAKGLQSRVAILVPPFRVGTFPRRERPVMTENRNFKRRVRARVAKTGESYTTALMHLRHAAAEETPLQPKSLRLAVAQSGYFDDPRHAAALRLAGEGIRRLMREAHLAGARVVHFPEERRVFRTSASCRLSAPAK